MPYVLIQHDVPDLARLMTAFLHDHLRRQDLGSKGGRLFRNIDNPNEFVVLLEWDEVDSARELQASPEFMEQLIQSDDIRWTGELTPPRISILDEIAWMAS